MAAAPKPMSAWLVLAIGSGVCAACNGMFAKLTTTKLTTSWAGAISGALDLSPDNKIVEFMFRGMFFLLNLLFNAIMWGLFTRALALASSTVRVSVINTSANFMVTALLGAMIFGESLPGLWWLGAAMLVAGSVIIGRREEKTVKQQSAGVAGADTLVSRGPGTEAERERFLDNPGAGSDEEGEDDDAVELATVPEIGSEDERDNTR